MEQIINSIMQFLQQGIAAIFKFLQLVWSWSFGQIVAVFQSDWKALPIWKLVVLIIAVGAIVYILYKAAKELWRRRSPFSARLFLCSAPSSRCYPISSPPGSSRLRAAGSFTTSTSREPHRREHITLSRLEALEIALFHIFELLTVDKSHSGRHASRS